MYVDVKVNGTESGSPNSPVNDATFATLMAEANTKTSRAERR